MGEVKSNRAWREECESLRQQLAAALAACKQKDEALREISGSNAPHIIVAMKALAIQPDDSALKDEWRFK